MQIQMFWGSSSSGMQFWGNSNLASDNVIIITKCQYTFSGVAPVRAGTAGVTHRVDSPCFQADSLSVFATWLFRYAEINL